MTNSISKWIPMKAKGKERPRFAGKGRKPYMTAGYESWKKEFALRFGRVDVEPPYFLKVISFRKIPKNWSKAKRITMECQPCEVAPDADNVAGAVMDALFVRDQNVSKLETAKYWGYIEGIHVELCTHFTCRETVELYESMRARWVR